MTTMILAQVAYPGLFPFAPGDGLAVSEAREIPNIRLEEASKEQLYTVGRFISSPSTIAHLLFIPQSWSTQMHHRGKTLGQPSGSIGYSQMLKVGRKRRRKKTQLTISSPSGERLTSGQDLVGDEVTAYAGPSPPKG